jgi:hypothetical protein
VSQAVTWRDRLISFRTLAYIILGLGVIRLVVAFLMPQEPSIMAPDEGTYAALAGVVGAGGDWASWNYNWGAGLYPGSRALLGPAAILISFGLPDLTAVRVVSVLYAVGAQLLLLAIARLARRRIAPEGPAGLPLVSWPMLGIAVFVLMPSNVLWSNLGLREAACAFWILGAVTCTAYLFTRGDWRWKALCGVGIAVSITMTFQSRVYLAAALVIALAVGIVWFGRERPRFSVTLAIAVVAGTLFGATLSLPARTATTVPPSAEVLAQAETLKAQAVAKAQAAADDRARAETLQGQAQAAELTLAALNAADGDAKAARELLRAQGAPSTALEVLRKASATSDPAREIQARREALASRAASASLAASQESSEAASLETQAAALLSQTQSVPADPGLLGSLQQGAAQAPTAINPDTYLERGSYQREVSAQYANSAIATDSCVGVPNPQSLRWCEITRLPGAAFAVMFRPLWPVDIPDEWSAVAVMASLENIAWLAIAVAVIWVLITRRFSFTRLLTISLAYGALVIAGMAALEGNFGTAFRHKSTTLWVFSIVLILATTKRLPRERTRPLSSAASRAR